ncbi:MAG TPA: PDZ domain-containing protein [Bacteroidota bacterium]
MNTILRFPRRTALAIVVISLAFACSPMTAVARQEDVPRAKAWLGVAIRDVTEEVANNENGGEKTGAYVSEVVRRSPADSAGIEEGDVIVEFGSKKIDDADALTRAVGKSHVGENVSVVLRRKGEKKTVQVTLSKYPRKRQFVHALDGLRERVWMLGNRSAQGMQLMELNEQLGEYFGAPNGTGILVEKVRKGSPAEKAGIKAGDVLVKIGKRTIDDLEDVSKAFSKFDDGEKADVVVLRKGATRTLTLEVEEGQDSDNFEIFRHNGPDAEMFHRPPFQENLFELPRWNEQEFRIDPDELAPQREVLRNKMEEMSKRLREHREDLRRALDHLGMRTV